MASEIRVDKINSLSGVGTVTLSPTGVDISGITTVSTLKVGTGLTASSDGDVFFTGIATATTFSGSGANLTALPAGQLTGTVADARISTLTASKLSGALPAISAASLTNVPAANVVGVHTSLTVTNATTTGTAVVGGGVTISESGIEASGIGITCANINGGEFSNRNMVINGAMEVDQRNEGSAVTSSPGGTLNFAADRNHFFNYNTGQLTATLQRVADAPAGFYNSNKVTITTPESSGGTPAADDRFSMQYRIEGRDLNRLSLGTSGAKAFVISFYIKVSVAGNYGLAVVGGSNNGRSYCMLYPATTSWSRVVLKVPGDTSGTYQAGTSSGLELKFGLYNGSSRSGADQGVAGTGSWQATSAPQGTTGQYQLGGTNGATWQITGLQVEAGTEATPFEHRRHGDEIALCQRYYRTIYRRGSSSDGNISIGGLASLYTSTAIYIDLTFPVKMRTAPTIVSPNGTDRYQACPTNCISFPTLGQTHTSTNCATATATLTTGNTAGRVGNVFAKTADWSEGEILAFDAEI